MTAEEFLARYCARSGLTVEGAKALGLVVEPCACDYSSCQGWAIVNVDQVETHRELYGPAPPADSGGPCSP